MEATRQTKAPEIDQKYRETYYKDVIGYEKDPDYYFDSYSHFNIHQQMLKDNIRTKAYMKAIKHNPDLFRDKIVLDVGSGTGILSIFAAQAGAKHVYAVQRAQIYIHSKRIIEQNGLTSKITVINAKIQQVQLPVQKVDIIISEWMGYCLLYEAMLDCVIYARDKWLKPNGLMFPNRARVYMALVEDAEFYQKKTNYWNEVYGVKMTCLRKWVLSQPLIDDLQKAHVLSQASKILDIDLYKVKVSQLDFQSTFKLQVIKNLDLYGFICWFDVDFQHGKQVQYISTSPYSKQTHWKQTIFYLEKPLHTRKKDLIQGSITITKSKPNPRQLDILLKFSTPQGLKLQQFYKMT